MATNHSMLIKKLEEAQHMLACIMIVCMKSTNSKEIECSTVVDGPAGKFKFNAKIKKI